MATSASACRSSSWTPRPSRTTYGCSSRSRDPGPVRTAYARTANCVDRRGGCRARHSGQRQPAGTQQLVELPALSSRHGPHQVAGLAERVDISQAAVLSLFDDGAEQAPAPPLDLLLHVVQAAACIDLETFADDQRARIDALVDRVDGYRRPFAALEVTEVRADTSVAWNPAGMRVEGGHPRNRQNM